MSRTEHSIRFLSPSGANLAARLELPCRTPIAWALFAHCFTCSKDFRAAVWITRGLARAGIGVLRFDFTGLGESEGDFADTNFASNIEDLIAAADWLAEHYQAPQLLIGHSLGGAAVLAAADRIESSRAVVTIAAPASTQGFAERLEAMAPELRAAGEARVDLGGRKFRVKRQLLDDLADDRVQRALPRLGRALLILHSPGDRVVSIDNARRLYRGARHPKSFVSLDGADHLVSRHQDADYVASLAAAWAARYLDPAPDQPDDQGYDVVVSGTAGLCQEVRADTHVLVADEPRSSGGDDAGPDPYDLLLAALGACTSMTLRLYADRKDWPLERAEVYLRQASVHAEDCDQCDAADARIFRIERTIRLRGDLDPDQRRRLIEIAERCPVHRTLRGKIEIATAEQTGEPEIPLVEK